ncbi:MAG: rod shape-determining protein RodA [Deltaproteobacteria bacterium]|nr:MAG: rod shape-determining protein RodA [Deltaproteobacteria bacterium]
MTTRRQAICNWPLAIFTLLVGGVGLVNLSSAARTAESNLALTQGIWFAAGILLALVLSRIDYRIFDKLAYPLWLLNLLLLGAVLVAGRVISGSQRWLHLGPVNFQPSELAKLTLILALAKYFNDERDLPARGYTLLGLAKPSSILYPVGAAGGLLLFWEHLPLAVSLRLVLLGGCLVWGTASFLVAIRSGRTGLHDLLSPVILLALPSVLILRQPDLGTTLVLAAIAGTMALFVKIRWTSLLLAVVIAVSAATSAWFFLLEDYQKRRVTAFLNPGSDIKRSGYHAWQSRIAVGSGQLHGKGYQQSTQTRFRFLPEQHTDFVFSVWAEEWGFLGCLGVVLLFFFWQLQLLNTAALARERLGVFMAVGFTAMVFWHTTVNVGMVIGLLPVVGITLPLWSYGGSSVLIIMMGVGILQSISLRSHTF